MGRLSLSKVNVGNLLVLLGVGWLGFSFWLPYATADRVFRIEDRTSEIAIQFTKAAVKMAEIDWKNEDVRDQILASVNKASGHTNPDSSLYLHAATPPPPLRGLCFLFEGKHYIYLLTNTPEKILGINAKIDKPGDEEPGKKPPVVPPPTQARAAPLFSEHNTEVVIGNLGLEESQLAAFRESGAILDRPHGLRAMPPIEN